MKEVFPGCTKISCWVINQVCNLCRGGSRELGEEHSTAFNEDWLQLNAKNKQTQSTSYQAPLTMSGDSDTSSADTCHPRHTMLNVQLAPSQPAHSISSLFSPPAGGRASGSVQFYCEPKDFFPGSAGVGKEGLGQQVWSEDSIKMQQNPQTGRCQYTSQGWPCAYIC